MEINEEILLYTHRQVLSQWKNYLIDQDCSKDQVNALVSALHDALINNDEGLQYLKSVL